MRLIFQCPILPELSMLAEDMACFARLFKQCPANQDEETLEAYKYAFKDFTAWNRPLNYYRMTTTKKFKEFLTINKDRFKIGVRTLQIFGTADTALSVGAAKLGNAFLRLKYELVEDIYNAKLCSVMDGWNFWRASPTGCKRRSLRKLTLSFQTFLLSKLSKV